MSFSYSGDPTTSDLDAVRFLLQDTTTPNEFLQNEEIAFLLEQEVNFYTAAAAGAMTISGRTHNTKSKKVGDLTLTFGAEQWATLAEWLRGRGSGYRVLTAGGLSKDEKIAFDEDDDAIEPDFFRDIFRHPKRTRPERRSDQEAQ